MEATKGRARQPHRALAFLLATAIVLPLSGCSREAEVAAPIPAASTPVPIQQPPAAPAIAADPATDLARTLASLRQVDAHPLFTMTFYGDYAIEPQQPEGAAPQSGSPWACSLFAAFADPAAALYGRNFDWEDNPALLLFTDPPGRHASVSMVDISYLGIDRASLAALDTPEGRERLLRAPLLPFDGMNEHGLTVGMAAVEPSAAPSDPAKPTVGSLRIIRLMLDNARDTAEALALFERYNVDFSGGPPIHYLIADRSGRSAVVELKDGEMHILRSESRWQAATNFYLAGSGAQQRLGDYRYATLDRALDEWGGALTPDQAMDLLAQVAQGNTRWSIVYGMASGEVRIAMGRRYEQVYTFQLDGVDAAS